MTDLSSALAAKSLTPFEGLNVIASGVEIPGAAGGLQPAMKIDPLEFHQGEEVWVAMRLQCGKVRHEPVVKDEPTGAQRRVHIFHVLGAAIVDKDAVESAVEAQRLAIAKAKENAAGIQRFDWGEEDEAMRAEHEDGQHSEPREGCPACEVAPDA